MKKILILVLFMFLTVLSPLMAEKIIFSEFGVSYASIITPRNLENNSTGSYDTAGFDAKLGGTIAEWVDLYAGAGFQFFVDRSNSQEYYTFYPVFAGIRINICPNLVIYPDICFEYGRAFANRHSQYEIIPGYNGDRDNTWLADYYNFGFGLNWNVNDASVLSVRIERPTYSNLNVSYGELQIIKTGIAWKILY